MKMLEWIHDRFRHNNIKPFKDLNIGNSCIRFSAQASHDDQEPYRKPSFVSLKEFSESEASRDNEASDAISELFHGFLTIGTLGSDASINEPATPTFATPLENITDGMIKVTENELKLINYELEKFLEAEEKEEGFEELSARNSDVSIISFGGKVMEKAEDEDYWKNLVCPLQGYLLGSPIDIPGAKNEEKASLGELFNNKEVAVENRHKHKSAMRFMKAVMKKVCPSSKSSLQAASDARRCYISEQKELHSATDSVSNKKKLHKVLRVFHKKIHPEPSTGERESDGVKKCMAKNTPKEGGDIKMVPKGSTSMDGIQSRGNKMYPLQQGNLNCNNLKGHGEHWIKIEEDYLVLEL